MRRSSLLIGSVLTMMLIVVPAFAEQAQISETYLTSLYASLLKNPDSASLQTRITAERTRIRTLAEAEIKASLPSSDAINTPPAQSSSQAPVTGSVEAQRAIVSGLQTKIQSWNADLSLLVQEEKIYYQSPEVQTGSNLPSRQTQTHQELLAKKAILEERIAAGTPILTLEQDRLSKLTQSERLEQFSVFFTIGFYLLVLVIIVTIERLLRSLLFARIPDRNRRYIATKVFAATVYILTTIWIVSRVLSQYPGILTTLAIIGAGIAFALQETVKDIVGWVLILQKRLFTLGDRIQIGDYVGEVIDISILRTTFLEVDVTHAPESTSLQDRTGKTFFLPNSVVLTQRVMNFNTTSDYVKGEMVVTITYESDWKKAEEILQQILTEETTTYAANERQQHNRRTRLLYVPYEPGAPRVFVELGSSGVQMTLRFTMPIDTQRDVISRISKKILEQFRSEKIDLAYNTIRSISTQVDTRFFRMKSAFEG